MNLSEPLLFSFALIGALGTAGAASAAETYAVDPVHSSVGFWIKRFFAKVPGSFPKFEGTLVFDRENPARSTLNAAIDVASINTADAKRDEHLRSPDFFDTAKYPSATFKSTSWKKTGADAFDVAGDLTLHGVTKPVMLKVKSLGFMPGMPPGSTLSGWEATSTLKRADFGIHGPTILGNMLSDEVVLSINVTAESKS